MRQIGVGSFARSSYFFP